MVSRKRDKATRCRPMEPMPGVDLMAAKISCWRLSLFLEERPDLIQTIVDGAVRNGRIVEKGPTYLANKDAFYVIYEGEYRTPSETFMIKTYFIETLFEGNVYALTFTTSKEGFAQSYSTFKEIATMFGLVPTQISVPKRP